VGASFTITSLDPLSSAGNKFKFQQASMILTSGSCMSFFDDDASGVWVPEIWQPLLGAGFTFANGLLQNDGTLLVSTSGNTMAGDLKYGAGVQIISGGAPSVNHGSLSTGSTNSSGTVTGVGANTSVVLSYSGAAAPNRSRCVASATSVSVTVETIVVTAQSATSATFSCYSVAAAPVLSNCDDFNYACVLQ
jgi:hypothetical protein